jgi:hypothetical protein
MESWFLYLINRGMVQIHGRTPTLFHKKALPAMRRHSTNGLPRNAMELWLCSIRYSLNEEIINLQSE